MQKRFTQLLVAILIVLSQQVQAQDPHFSQFYASPLQLNPAMTGVFEGSYRLAVNYREQYASILSNHPFRTIGASFDMRKRIVRSDYLSFGLALLSDQAGSSLFNQYRGNLSVSYMKQLGGSKYSSESQYLVAGAQVGLGQNRIDPGKLWFSAQYDATNINVNQAADNMEANLTNSSNIFLDFNAGLMWYARLSDNKSIYFGGALNHLSPVDISLYDNNKETLHMRWVIHGGAELPLSRELSILPAVFGTNQGESFQINTGANFRYSNHDWREVAIRAGFWTRVSKKVDGGSHVDALIFSTILEMERFNLGLSYDVNSSSLRDASQSRGAFEVSLIYIHPSKDRYKVNCPKF